MEPPSSGGRKVLKEIRVLIIWFLSFPMGNVYFWMGKIDLDLYYFVDLKQRAPIWLLLGVFF
jgi:hypothetical protein